MGGLGDSEGLYNPIYHPIHSFHKGECHRVLLSKVSNKNCLIQAYNTDQCHSFWLIWVFQKVDSYTLIAMVNVTVSC